MCPVIVIIFGSSSLGYYQSVTMNLITGLNRAESNYRDLKYFPGSGKFELQIKCYCNLICWPRGRVGR